MKLQDFSEAFMKEPQNGFRKDGHAQIQNFALNY